LMIATCGDMEQTSRGVQAEAGATGPIGIADYRRHHDRRGLQPDGNLDLAVPNDADRRKRGDIAR
jgi:hypothetical protein